MKKIYLTPAIQVIALENVSPILAGSTGTSQTISDEEPDDDSGTENTGTGFIGFGEGKIEETE